MTWAGWLGLTLLGLGLLAIAFELLLILSSVRSLLRRIQQLRTLWVAESGYLDEQMARLRLTQRDWRTASLPLRRLRRWLFHPISLALMASYRRRRTAG